MELNKQGPCSNCGAWKSLHSAVTMGRNMKTLRWFCSDLYDWEKDKDDISKQFKNSTEVEFPSGKRYEAPDSVKKLFNDSLPWNRRA